MIIFVEPEIVFEDKDILVLDKPSGMVVNKAETVKMETVQDWVGKRLGIKASDSRRVVGALANEPLRANEGSGLHHASLADFFARAGVVHRLDKETSGLLLVAKNQESFENLQRQFKERVVKKRYLALVHGEVRAAEGEIRAPVGRLPWNREKFGVLPGGREAVTRYRLIKQYVLNSISYSLLELFPETGRTHQIRIHLKYLGHPIVGDLTYAGRKTARRDRQFCPRLFLHAAYLGFNHPSRKSWVEFDSPLPADLEIILRDD